MDTNTTDAAPVAKPRKKAGRKPRAADETMTRRELASLVYKKIHGNAKTRRVSAQTVLDVVQSSIDVLQEAILQGKHIEFRDFGVFEVIVRRSRQGRNPNKPDISIPIPPRRTVKFKPSRKMLQALCEALPINQ